MLPCGDQRMCSSFLFPLLQGLIVLGEASPPEPAVDDSSRPLRAEVKLEPGADRLVSASSGTDRSSCFTYSSFGEGRFIP